MLPCLLLDKEIPGAKLTILDKDGKEIESWVSEEKPHYIEKLPVGDYTLHEVTAPDGYEVSADAWQVLRGICRRKTRRTRSRLKNRAVRGIVLLVSEI